MEFTSRRSRKSRPQVTIPVSRLRPDTRRTATRRLSFQTPSFYARHPSTSQEVFVPESPERPTNGHYWGPGESLPVTDFQPVATSSPVQTQTEQPDLYSVIQGMQNTMETNFQSLQDRLSDVEKRMDCFEAKINYLPLTEPVSESPINSESTTRSRKNPPELQHQVRMIHSSFDEDKQLRPDERINSPHNQEVMMNIIREVGTERFTAKQIKSAVVTYRSTRRHAAKGISEETKKKVRVRSRQQRLFEKRTKVVKSREMSKWDKVSADMMSEEEEDDNGTFIRHRYAWRSDNFNRFINKLEERIAKNSKKSLAKNRTYGDTLNTPPPLHAHEWMKGGSTAVTNNDPQSDDIFSSSDETENNRTD